MKFTRLPLMALFASLLLVVMACNLDNSITPIEGDETNLDIPPIPDEPVGPYWVDGSKLTKNDEAVFYKGGEYATNVWLGESRSDERMECSNYKGIYWQFKRTANRWQCHSGE